MGLPSAQGDQAEDTLTLLLYVNNFHAINLLHAYVMGNTARSRRPPDQAGATPTACKDIFWCTCRMDYGMGFTAQGRSPPWRVGTTLTACNAMLFQQHFGMTIMHRMFAHTGSAAVWPLAALWLRRP